MHPTLTLYLLRCKGLALVLDTSEQLMEGVGKLLHTFILKLLCHLVVVDAELFEGIKFSVSLGNIVLDTVAYSSMVTEVLDSFQRHCVHSLRAD